MVSLVTVADGSGADAMSVAGLVSVGATGAPEPTVGPVPSTITIAPPVMAILQPVPEVAPPETAIPQSAPSVITMPAPTATLPPPEPTSPPTPPASGADDEVKIKLALTDISTLIQSTFAPTVQTDRWQIPATPPQQPAGKVGMPYTRRMTLDEITQGAAISILLWIGASFCGLLFLWALTILDKVWLALLFAVPTFFLARQAIFQGAVRSAKLIAVSNPRLGAPIKLRCTIALLRKIPITGGTITVVAEERAIRGNGRNARTLTETCYSQTTDIISTPAIWTGGNEVTLEAQMGIPDALPSTFKGGSNFITWSAKLWVGIPSWYPDIRVRIPLDVPPLRAGGLPAPVSKKVYDLPELDDLHAQLTLESAAAPGGISQLAIGQPAAFTLTITPEKSAPEQKIWLEVGFVTAGSGNREHMNVVSVLCFPHGWAAGATQQFSEKIVIPPSFVSSNIFMTGGYTPVSYQGKFVVICWQITIRREIPWLPDPRQEIPVVVAPGNNG